MSPSGTRTHDFVKEVRKKIVKKMIGVSYFRFFPVDLARLAE